MAHLAVGTKKDDGCVALAVDPAKQRQPEALKILMISNILSDIQVQCEAPQ